MISILKTYYGISMEIDHLGYFTYQNEQYYLCQLKDVHGFLTIYYYYQNMMCQCYYSVVKNKHHQWFTHNYILFKYHAQTFSYHVYLENMLTPLDLPKIAVKDIKEQWIHKIDQVFKLIKKFDEQSQPIIYYYLGLGENSINILNDILKIDNHASIPLGLALIHPIDNEIYELVNPCYYMISTRIRHIVTLLQSHILSLKELQNIIDEHYYDIYEMIYIYAHMLYPGYFFDCLLQNQSILEFYQHLQSEKHMLKSVYDILSFYVSLPKIHWINDENML